LKKEKLERIISDVCICDRCGRQNYIKYTLNGCVCVCGYAMLPANARVVRRALEEFLMIFSLAKEDERQSMVR